MSKRKKRVIVGMSGGVDSSVTALLLKKRGYDVIGITMQLLPKEEEKQSACCNLNAVNDAKRVAGAFKIPHYTINLRDTFQKNVMDHFVSQYANGMTPNPCVECNRHIKFTELHHKAMELGADYIATGHYCQKTYSPGNRTFYLKKGKDPFKDQSYFLYMLNSDILKQTLFPLGPYLKSEIRKIAEENNLVNAKKADSQEICFVTKDTYKDFIRARLEDPTKLAGNIIDIAGNILGRHNGIFNYTIGQRKGLGISSAEPLYVIKIRSSDNTVIVGGKGELKTKQVALKGFSLVNPAETILNRSFDLKMRYQMTPVTASVASFEDDHSVTLAMTVPQDFVAPGQSGVLYDGDRVVGGGTIIC